jgi:hypothetical protein
MSEFLQSSDALAHNWEFSRSVINSLDRDGSGGTSIDATFIIFDGDKKSFLGEDAPKFFD